MFTLLVWVVLAKKGGPCEGWSEWWGGPGAVPEKDSAVQGWAVRAGRSYWRPKIRTFFPPNTVFKHLFIVTFSWAFSCGVVIDAKLWTSCETLTARLKRVGLHNMSKEFQMCVIFEFGNVQTRNTTQRRTSQCGNIFEKMWRNEKHNAKLWMGWAVRVSVQHNGGSAGTGSKEGQVWGGGGARKGTRNRP